MHKYFFDRYANGPPKEGDSQQGDGEVEPVHSHSHAHAHSHSHSHGHGYYAEGEEPDWENEPLGADRDPGPPGKYSNFPVYEELEGLTAKSVSVPRAQVSEGYFGAIPASAPTGGPFTQQTAQELLSTPALNSDFPRLAGNVALPELLNLLSVDECVVVEGEGEDLRATRTSAIARIGADPRTLLGEVAGVTVAEIAADLAEASRKRGGGEAPPAAAPPVLLVRKSDPFRRALELLVSAPARSRVTPVVGVTADDDLGSVVGAVRYGEAAQALRSAATESQSELDAVLDKGCGDVLDSIRKSEGWLAPANPMVVGDICSLGSALNALSSRGACEFFVKNQQGIIVHCFDSTTIIAEILFAKSRTQHYLLR